MEPRVIIAAGLSEGLAQLSESWPKIVVLCIVGLVLGHYTYARRIRSYRYLKSWAERRGYTLLDCKRWPFTPVAVFQGYNQHDDIAFRVKILDRQERERAGFVIIRSVYWHFDNDNIEVFWDRGPSG